MRGQQWNVCTSEAQHRAHNLHSWSLCETCQRDWERNPCFASASWHRGQADWSSCGASSPLSTSMNWPLGWLVLLREQLQWFILRAKVCVLRGRCPHGQLQPCFWQVVVSASQMPAQSHDAIVVSDGHFGYCTCGGQGELFNPKMCTK